MTQSAATSRLPCITIRLTAVEKHRFADLAASRGQSESQLGLTAIRILLQSNDGEFPPASVAPLKESASDRITIRLRPGDRRAIAERAGRRRAKASTYLAAMVRAHLSQNPPLTEHELGAFKQAVVVLAGVGRTLLLVARSGHLPGASTPDLQQDLTRLRGTVALLEQRLHEFVRAALVSWESGHE